MGTAEIHDQQIIIQSHIITYGNGANPAITELIRDEIESMWNQPRAIMTWKGKELKIIFVITAACELTISAEEIYENTDPRNNYFRIEEFAHGNISFVDGIGCNSGYFKVENLYRGSTTAAHEYGHTIGLDHPADTDLRGKGIPGIMYPRGTLVDPAYQYNPAAIAGDSSNGGTMHPRYRKVFQQDIDQLKLHKLNFKNEKAIVGEFSSIWHPDHSAVRHPGL